MSKFYIKLGADITEFQGAMQKASKTLEASGKKMQKVGKNLSKYVTAPLLAVGAAAVKVAADTEGVKNAFNRLNKPGLLNNLRAATNNTVSDLELMKAAVQAKNFDIPLSQLGTLLEFANRRAKDTGQSVDYLVNSIVTGIGRKSPLILDNLGISATALKDKLGGVSAASSSIAEVTEAVGSIARAELLKMGTDVGTTKDGFNQLKASLSNAGAEIGALINTALKPFIDTLVDGIKWFNGLDDSTKKLGITLAAIFAATGPLLVGLGYVTSTLIPLMLAGFSSMAGLIGALVSPVGLVIAAVAALAAGILYVYDNWDAISERISDIGWWRNTLIDMANLFIQFNPFSLIIDAVNELTTLLGGAAMINPFDQLRASLTQLKGTQQEYKHEFGSFKDAVVGGFDSMKTAASGFANSIMGDTTEDGGHTVKTAIEKMPIIAATSVGETTTQMRKLASDTKLAVNDSVSSLQIYEDSNNKVANTIASSIQQMNGETIKSMDDFGKSLYTTVKRTIGALIAEGVAAVVSATLLQSAALGPAAIPIGAAAGVAANALFNAAIPAFANGGIISGPTLGIMGEYPGAKSNPEVVAPLNKLKSMIGGGNTVIPELVVRGSDFVFMFDNARNQQNKIFSNY